MGQLLDSFLFEVTPLDPFTFVAGAGVFLVVAAVASPRSTLAIMTAL